MPTEAPVHVVCAVVTDARSRLLVTQRPPGKHLAGLWEFPGGKVEAGEEGATALQREILEELGLTISVDRHLLDTVHDYGRIRIRLSAYTARITGGTLTLHEHSAHRWCTPAQLTSLDWAPADLPIVHHLLHLPTP